MEKDRFRDLFVKLACNILCKAANENGMNGESEGRLTPTEIVEVSGKVNYVYKSIQKIYEPGAELKSGLYVFSPNKTFPIGMSLSFCQCSCDKFYW